MKSVDICRKSVVLTNETQRLLDSAIKLLVGFTSIKAPSQSEGFSAMHNPTDVTSST